MPLQRRIIQVPYSGLQTKVDPKIAPMGTYAQVDNFIMNRFPELVKRDGLLSIGQNTTPDNITAAYSYLNETGVITNNSLYSYSSSLDQYQLKGKTASPIITAKPVISNTYAQTVPDSAITQNGIMGVAWEDSRGGVYLSIKDIVTDTFIVSDVTVSNTAVKPKVVAQGTHLGFLWIEPAVGLRIKLYNTLTNTFNSQHNVSTAVASCYTYDTIPCSDNILIVVAETNAAPDVLKAYYWHVLKDQVGSPTGNGLSAPTSLLFANSGVLPPAITVAENVQKTYITVSVYNDSNEIYTKAFYPYLIPITAEKQAAAATTDPGWTIASCVDENNNTYIFYSSLDTLSTSYQAMVSDNLGTQTIGYNRLFFTQMSVVSKSFFYSGNAYVVLGYESALQSTYFGVRDDGACFGRMFSSLGGGISAKSNSVSSFNLSPEKSDTYITALLKTTEIVSSANSYFTSTSVFTEEVFFAPASIDNKVLGKFLNIAGGYLKQYDGSPTIFEQGFHLYPEQPTAVQSVGAGTIPNGTYSYLACWEWKDNQGQLHRSNTSVPIQISVTGANNTVTITVPSLPITNKETRFSDVRSPVIFAVYRTQTNGTTYYRVNQLPNEFVYNDPTANTISFVDTKPDSAIISNSVVYTTGGVFDNITLPATNLMCVAKNRVVVAGTDTEPNRIFFSKQKEEGVAIEFSNELSIIVDSLGGNITAIAAMDDKILIFKESLIYYVAGEGPDPTGNNGSFTIPLLISADCGCVYPQSIVLTGLGIMFLSQKGLYLCDRQLTVSYVGQSLDAITTNPKTKNPNFQITSAVNLPEQNQVFFTTNGNQVLVFDTFFQLWSTHTLKFRPISSTAFNSQWYPCGQNETYVSVSGRAKDGDNQPIQSSLKTNWINVADLEGFARIYGILVAGDNASLDHTLVMKLYYDFETFPREVLKITPNSLDGANYGDDSPYGVGMTAGSGNPYGIDSPYGTEVAYGVSSLYTSGNLYGGSFDGTYQFLARPKMQKCSSIQIEIYDEFPTGDTTQSFKFTGLSLVVGMKGMYNKNLPFNRRFTP